MRAVSRSISFGGMSIRLTQSRMRHNISYTSKRRTAVPQETKRDRLRRLGVLNPRPEAVRAPWFHGSGFFDPDDLLQVKYEMLRHARQDGVNKAQAAALFGLSRPTYYQAEAAFEREGLAGLLPRARGPKSAHKLTDEVVRLIEQHRRAGAPLQARSLAALVQSTLGVSVHPRSIERAMARKKKR
jgi:transposase